MFFQVCYSPPTFVRRPHWIQKVLSKNPLANKTMVFTGTPLITTPPFPYAILEPDKKDPESSGSSVPQLHKCLHYNKMQRTSGLVQFFRARSSLGFPRFYEKLKQFVAASGREQTESTPSKSRHPPCFHSRTLWVLPGLSKATAHLFSP